MLNNNLNLARKWRSKNFDQIIGQDLCVRILKNGLYLNSFFPVYLFSGQRGCGKTSTARVFAASINCLQLEKFQKDAKSFTVPCLECSSCKAVELGKHPDFIEIDAASHTGVDNVRNIIDASSLLPLMGRKKIYLIDEAHMLSKAAFNAFLKILEEPPSSVLFILATTDVQKIIETVRSRSFQLFFSSISPEVLIKHLEDICKLEAIPHELDGIRMIVKESQGCARDAINLLEQVRFSNSSVNKIAVLSALGHISDEHLLMFFDQLINKKNVQDFLKLLDKINFYSFSAEYIWNRLLELFRMSIRIKYEVDSKQFCDSQEALEEVVNKSSLKSIILALDEFCKNELIFFKSLNKNLFLELLCLRIIDSNFVNVTPQKSISDTKPILKDKIIPTQERENLPTAFSQMPKPEPVNVEKNESWSNFIIDIKEIKDPLIDSVFTQANFVNFDESSGEVVISFLKKFIFFKDLIDDTLNVWSPILKKKFNANAVLKIVFEDKEYLKKEPTQKKEEIINENVKKNVEVNKSEKLDFSDTKEWKMTNLLLQYFPGKITEIVGTADE